MQSKNVKKHLKHPKTSKKYSKLLTISIWKIHFNFIYPTNGYSHNWPLHGLKRESANFRHTADTIQVLCPGSRWHWKSYLRASAASYHRRWFWNFSHYCPLSSPHPLICCPYWVTTDHPHYSCHLCCCFTVCRASWKGLVCWLSQAYWHDIRR